MCTTTVCECLNWWFDARSRLRESMCSRVFRNERKCTHGLVLAYVQVHIIHFLLSINGNDVCVCSPRWRIFLTVTGTAMSVCLR